MVCPPPPPPPPPSFKLRAGKLKTVKLKSLHWAVLQKSAPGPYDPSLLPVEFFCVTSLLVYPVLAACHLLAGNLQGNSSAEKMLKKTENNNVLKARKSASHYDAKSTAVKHHGALENSRITQSESSLQRKKRDTFGHNVYENAAQIYLHLKGELSASSLPKFDDDLERRRAYSLGFGTKRCKFCFSVRSTLAPCETR